MERRAREADDHEHQEVSPLNYQEHAKPHLNVGRGRDDGQLLPESDVQYIQERLVENFARGIHMQEAVYFHASRVIIKVVRSRFKGKAYREFFYSLCSWFIGLLQPWKLLQGADHVRR